MDTRQQATYGMVSQRRTFLARHTRPTTLKKTSSEPSTDVREQKQRDLTILGFTVFASLKNHAVILSEAKNPEILHCVQDDMRDAAKCSLTS